MATRRSGLPLLNRNRALATATSVSWLLLSLVVLTSHFLEFSPAEIVLPPVPYISHRSSARKTRKARLEKQDSAQNLKTLNCSGHAENLRYCSWFLRLRVLDWEFDTLSTLENFECLQNACATYRRLLGNLKLRKRIIPSVCSVLVL